MSPSSASSVTYYTPIPDALLGEFLANPTTPWELPCLLRVLHLLYLQRGGPPALALSELRQDAVVSQLLAPASPGASLPDAFRRAIAVGVLLQAAPPSAGSGQAPKAAEPHYLLNTQANHRWLASQGWAILPASEGGPSPEPGAVPFRGREQPNIFALYEQHIGVLTPLVAEELKDAESTYPEAWVQNAFQEAILRNRRGWPYIAHVLARWAREGRDRGELERYPEKADPEAYLRSWGSARRG